MTLLSVSDGNLVLKVEGWDGLAGSGYDHNLEAVAESEIAAGTARIDQVNKRNLGHRGTITKTKMKGIRINLQSEFILTRAHFDSNSSW
jgi:hypothetical protein